MGMVIITGEAVMDPPDFVLPSALKTIDEKAFKGVRATVVYIPDGVTSIGANAFANCTSLTQVRIPNGCTIDRTAFSGCWAELTIFGTPGSDAQALAQEKGYNFQIEW